MNPRQRGYPTFREMEKTLGLSFLSYSIYHYHQFIKGCDVVIANDWRGTAPEKRTMVSYLRTTLVLQSVDFKINAFLWMYAYSLAPGKHT